MSTGHDSFIDDVKTSRRSTLKRDRDESSKQGPPEEFKSRVHPTFNLRDRRNIGDQKKDANFLFYGKNQDRLQDEQDDDHNVEDEEDAEYND